MLYSVILSRRAEEHFAQEVSHSEEHLAFLQFNTTDAASVSVLPNRIVARLQSLGAYCRNVSALHDLRLKECWAATSGVVFSLFSVFFEGRAVKSDGSNPKFIECFRHRERLFRVRVIVSLELSSLIYHSLLLSDICNTVNLWRFVAM